MRWNRWEASALIGEHGLSDRFGIPVRAANAGGGSGDGQVVRSGWATTACGALVLALSGILPQHGTDVAGLALLATGAAVSLACWFFLTRPPTMVNEGSGDAGTVMPRALVALAVGFGLLRGGTIIWARGGFDMAPLTALLISSSAMATAAVIEEVFFRGILMHWLQRVGVVFATLFQGAVFGLIHLPSTAWVYIVVVAADGVFFGILAAKAGLRLSILAHGTLNAFVNTSVASRVVTTNLVAAQYIAISLTINIVFLLLAIVIDRSSDPRLPLVAGL